MVEPGEAMVEIEGLTKRYGEFTALAGLDLSVRRGEFFALLGPNGAGKTTTMRILMGFLRANAGRARVAGEDCFERRVELKRVIGYLPDEPVFYEYLRGREILRFAGEMHGLDAHTLNRRSAELVEQLELDDALEEYATNYSRGMKKKLALACALLHEPRLLILDEPTSGLDPIATRSLNQLLEERRRRGATVLLSSHLLDQVERQCERIAIVARGSIAAVGTPESLKRECGENASLEEVFFAVAGKSDEASA